MTNCPLCDQNTEISEHITQCTHPKMRNMRKVHIDSQLESHLFTCNTQICALAKYLA